VIIALAQQTQGLLCLTPAKLAKITRPMDHIGTKQTPFHLNTAGVKNFNRLMPPILNKFHDVAEAVNNAGQLITAEK
jgi:hypothetical protein